MPSQYALGQLYLYFICLTKIQYMYKKVSYMYLYYFTVSPCILIH